MKTRVLARPTKLILACLVIALCCWLLQRLFVFPDMSHYRGDGHFENLSWRDGIVFPAYRITMPAFDLTTERHDRFLLSGVPNIGRPCHIMFGVLNPQNDPDRPLEEAEATIDVSVVNSRGQTLASMSGNLFQFKRMTSSDAFFSLYEQGTCSFFPNPADELTIKVTYRPDKQLRGYKGIIYLYSRTK
jgi:hypothetical protein